MSQKNHFSTVKRDKIMTAISCSRSNSSGVIDALSQETSSQPPLQSTETRTDSLRKANIGGENPLEPFQENNAITSTLAYEPEKWDIVILDPPLLTLIYTIENLFQRIIIPNHIEGLFNFVLEVLENEITNSAESTIYTKEDQMTEPDSLTPSTSTESVPSAADLTETTQTGEEAFNPPPASPTCIADL